MPMSKIEYARTVIMEQLTIHGELEAGAIRRFLREKGISLSVIKRALEHLHIMGEASYQRRGYPARVYWRACVTGAHQSAS